ncbi:unnamed protein product [Didymodactylos carnosus]|uniref:Integrase catalytic domain-containing protein n=1 Tax=Didymodactylos carnosus TaxID=1234261 RepID=A0A8S2WKX0_9BILA|nr:unnamed protein product [Didymodactylos carnosus]
MIPKVMAAYHDHPTSGHFGIRRTWHKLKDRYFWPNMMSTIENYIKSCEKCAKFNIRRTKPPSKLYPITPSKGIFETIGMEFWGSTSHPSAEGNRYVLVVTDYLSKYVIAKAMPNNTATTIAQFIVEDVILKYGVPRKLITDQESHFKNELMGSITRLCGCKHVFATTYHPQTNGQVERFNATFYPQLAKLHDENVNDWDAYLTACVFAYNTGVHATTGYSPFQLMFARQPVLPFDAPKAVIVLTKPNDYWTQINQLMNGYKKSVKYNINYQQ